MENRSFGVGQGIIRKFDYNQDLMSDISHYESRNGRLSCTSRELFDFVTDIRNFERFLHAGTINGWQAEKERCSFRFSMVGTVSIRIIEKEPWSLVVYDGDALKQNDFKLILQINHGPDDPAEVKVLLDADFNPMLRMVADSPIHQFMETLIQEMENFRGWKDIV
jgi:hypothetical protein